MNAAIGLLLALGISALLERALAGKLQELLLLGGVGVVCLLVLGA